MRSKPADDFIDVAALRCKGERVMTVVLSVFTIAIYLLILWIFIAEFFGPLKLGLYEIAILLAIPLSMGVTVRLIRGSLLGNSIQVGPRQFPEIHELVQQLKRRMRYDKPVDVFIVADSALKAFLTRFIGTRYIILNSGLVSSMLPTENRKELTWVLARTIGHLKGKHFRFWFVPQLVIFEAEVLQSKPDL